MSYSYEQDNEISVCILDREYLNYPGFSLYVFKDPPPPSLPHLIIIHYVLVLTHDFCPCEPASINPQLKGVNVVPVHARRTCEGLEI